MVRELITEASGKFPGGEGYVTFDKLSVLVRVVDSRKVFGRIDVLVTPVNGYGEQWISMDRVEKRNG